MSDNPIIEAIRRQMRGEPGATFGRAEPPTPAPELEAIGGRPLMESTHDELRRKARTFLERVRAERENKPTDSK